MIKNYSELSSNEIKKAFEFLNSEKQRFNDLEEFDKYYNNNIYDFGKGGLFYFKEEEVIAGISLVLKETKLIETAYIFDIKVNKSEKDSCIIVSKLINKAKNIAQTYGAKNIFLGNKEETVLNILTSLGYKKSYTAILMTLDDRKARGETLDLIKLSNKNRHEYVKIYNKAFSNVPNGSSLSESEVEENLKKIDENKCYFIVSLDGTSIGFMDYEIKDGVGIFDIGLCPEFRGKGYGKMLLETAIDFLNDKNVETISLIVISKNTLAHNLYIKRGFKEEKVISNWFEL